MEFLDEYLLFIWKASRFKKRPLRLANYDIPFVNGVATQIMSNIPLSEKQASLGKLLVLKYARQLSNKNVMVNTDSLEKTLLPIRPVNNDKTVTLADKILVKFQYNEELISLFRTYAQTALGCVKWNKDEKQWELSPTESNIIWAAKLSEFGFIVDQAISDLAKQMRDLIEQNPNFMTLVNKDGKYIVEGAPIQLEEALAQFNGDMLTLADVSSTYGFAVSENIVTQLQDSYPTLVNLILNRETQVSLDNVDLALRYAKQFNRFPLLAVGDIFSEEYLRNVFNGFKITKEKISSELSAGRIFKGQCFVVSTDENLSPVRLLITSKSLLVGVAGRKIMQDAEKIIWACPKVMT